MKSVRRLLALTLAVTTGASAVHCGARTELPLGRSRTPPSTAFCGSADYETGFSELAIHVLLDKSDSMNQDGKWDEATAALGAFVDDPDAADIGIGLQYFPLGSACDSDHYALPAVALGKLPGNAAKVKASIAKQILAGSTPTLPALRGAIEYARGQILSNPSAGVVVALLTDGAPNTCDSSTENVAALAKEAATTSPAVLTFVIGLDTGYVKDMEQIAEAGGTGKPILIGNEPGSAQRIVDGLRFLRDSEADCRFAVPPSDASAVLPSDLTVVLDPEGEARSLPRVDGVAGCGDGFYADAPLDPAQVVLCPATCEALRATPRTKVRVVAGCGGVAPDGGAPPTDGGTCTSNVEFGCRTSCEDPNPIGPSCIGGEWTCPAGTIPDKICTTCPAVPHGCCGSDGTLAEASCIDGVWTCPPGAALFGSTPACSPPAACAALMPCAFGQYCKVADATCGTADWLGTCLPSPPGCSENGPFACGCDGVTYPSECAANAAGVDISRVTVCATPGGAFPCGPYFCLVASEICKHTLDLGADVPDAYACIAVPPGCPTGCGCNQCEPCPPGNVCNEMCGVVDGGSF